MVLTGGTARRLGGADKAALDLGGRTLLDRVLGLVAAWPHVVVGEPVAGVPTVREQPVGTGPAAALLAGAEALPDDTTLLLALAVDMPHVTASTLARLRDAVVDDGQLDGQLDGALLVDAGGRRQYLCAAYCRARLLAIAPADRDGLPLHRLVSGLRLAEVAAVGEEAHDVDTWEDLARARERLDP